MNMNAIYLNYDKIIRVEQVDVKKPGGGLHYSSAPPIPICSKQAEHRKPSISHEYRYPQDMYILAQRHSPYS